jgi:hypothetical protein
MRGVLIEYGSQTKSQNDLALLIGWKKPPRRNPANRRKEEVNDGKAPDTTAALLPKKVRGRPKNSPNLDKNPFTTYISYSPLDKPTQMNRCWMSAALESLYSLFNPLWLRNTIGLCNEIFLFLLQHFNSRSTWELSQVQHIRSILSRGQNSLFDAAHNINPNSFCPGKEASCDHFLEVLLDQCKKTDKPFPPEELFTVTEVRTASCERALDV